MLRAEVGRRSSSAYRLMMGLCRSPASGVGSLLGSPRCPQLMRLLFCAGSFRGLQQGNCPPPGADIVKPLNGVRILDLTRILAGPFATMNMGDLGAEVIKVEKPGSGDDTRSWGPPFVGNESIYFLSVNRNKKSIAVNMRKPKGAKIIKELAAVSDVLVENYVPGKLAGMGLGYDDINKVAPHIVYCSITGYGQTGPKCQRAGYDSVAAAVSGLLHITGPESGSVTRLMFVKTPSVPDDSKAAVVIPLYKGKNSKMAAITTGGLGLLSEPGKTFGRIPIKDLLEEGEPVRPGVAMTDLATGLYAYGAIMAALLQRHKTGKGMHLDCNLLSSQVACLTYIASNFLNCRTESRRWGTAHASIVPYQAFQTKDGYIVVGAGNDQQFATVCKILSLPEIIHDSRFKTNQQRVFNRKELIGILSARFLEEETSKWLELFEGSGVPSGPINSMEQVFSDPQVEVIRNKNSFPYRSVLLPRSLKVKWNNVLHNRLVMEMEHPTVGKITVPGPAVRYSQFEVSCPKPPPLLGQHTLDILKNTLGYKDDALQELFDAGVIAQHELK